MTLREIVYMCMDEIKLNSEDSFFTEDHIKFLVGKYRSLILKRAIEQEKKPLGINNTQEICIQLKPQAELCQEPVLKSTKPIPDLLKECKANIYAGNYINSEHIIFTSMERLRYTTYNKWTSRLIYAAKGPDDYLYLKSSNPQFLYLSEVKMSAVFDDYEKAFELSCDENGDKPCDTYDMEFPLDGHYVPVVIEAVVKELLGVKYQPKDNVNNANEDTPSIKDSRNG